MGCLFDKESNVIYDSGDNNLRDSLIYRDSREDIERRHQQSIYQKKIEYADSLMERGYSLAQVRGITGLSEYRLYSRPRSPFLF